MLSIIITRTCCLQENSQNFQFCFFNFFFKYSTKHRIYWFDTVALSHWQWLFIIRGIFICGLFDIFLSCFPICWDILNGSWSFKHLMHQLCDFIMNMSLASHYLRGYLYISLVHLNEMMIISKPQGISPQKLYSRENCTAYKCCSKCKSYTFICV